MVTVTIRSRACRNVPKTEKKDIRLILKSIHIIDKCFDNVDLKEELFVRRKLFLRKINYENN